MPPFPIVGKNKDRGDAPFVMQRDDERARVVLAGQRTDTGDGATLLALQELCGAWVLYSPLGEPGIRITREDATTLAEQILAIR
ncbi:MAG: hypothetical protein ACRDSH_01915 [Pseudonocardiaceae bacterium]